MAARDVMTKFGWLRFPVPGLVCGTWACFFFKLYRSPVLAKIQNPHFHVLTLATAGILFFGAFLYPLLLEYHVSSARMPLAQSLGAVLLWLSPLLVFLLFPLDTFSMDRFLQKSDETAKAPAPARTAHASSSLSFQSGPPRPWDDVPADQTVNLTVWDLDQAADDPDSKKELAGRTVQVMGQYVPDAAKQFKILRVVMLCCAADAQPVRATVQGVPPPVHKGDWLQVTGKISLIPPDQSLVVVADRIDPMPAPADVYLY